MLSSTARRILLSGAVIMALGLGSCAGSGYPMAGTWSGYSDPYGYYGPSTLFPYAGFYSGIGVWIGSFPEQHQFDHDLHHGGSAPPKGRFGHEHFPSAGFHHPDFGDHGLKHSEFSHHDFGHDHGHDFRNPG
jgi:hypothetical protein